MYTVLKFTACWCGPCQEMNDRLRETPLNIPNVELRSVDVDDEERMTDAFDVTTVPTIVVMDGEVELARHTGGMTIEQLNSFITSAINGK